LRPWLARTARLWARLSDRGRPGVTILGYHSVDDTGDGMSVRPRTFAAQMRTLASLSGKAGPVPTYSLDDALDRVAAGDMEERAVVLTFDDAWLDNLTHAVAPLLDHGLPATVYAPSRLLGTGSHMSRTELLEIVEAGWSVGAHTRTHPDLRRCSDAELESEVRGSREDLEDLLGVPVTTFAYPAGHFDDRVVDAVRAAGFRSAVTTRQAWLRPDTPALRLPRSFVEEVDDATFAAIALGGLTFLRPVDVARERLASRSS
jgi:peptidoglycan/xylan/chitin deacetylase (PgdA/CDA1 family)